ncbi:MAG TPA: PD-(D/E)XK motif protein [Longimicrobium sp.]|nr:PD-(D/E)XK motif protein [Longimicrobium sp.]
MSAVAAAWTAVRDEGRTESGWHVRRVYPDAHCDLLAGIHQPDDTPGLLLETALTHVPGGLALPRASGFGVETSVLSGGLAGRVRFALALTDYSYGAIFTVLCEDVAVAAAEAPSAREAVRSWIGRLHAWQAFMSRHGTTGLSESAVVGLIGELLVLREKIIPLAGTRSALDMWAGPLGEPNDFALPSGFVEVKTTSRQVPEVLEIANVVQLDDSRGAILLVHVHLRPDPSGLSLPDVVSSARALIVESAPDRLIQFERLLIGAGYIDAQADLYPTRYTPDRTEMYRVDAGFPRIRSAEVRPGLRSCRYSIELHACVPYITGGNTLREMMGELNRG